MVTYLNFELIYTYNYICHRKFPRIDQMPTFLKSFMSRSPFIGIHKNLTHVLQKLFRWHPNGCSVWHKAAEIQNIVTPPSNMYPPSDLMLAGVRLHKINCFSDLPDYKQGVPTSELGVHTHTHRNARVQTFCNS